MFMAVIYLDPSSPVSHRFLASPTPSFTFPNVSHHPVAHFLLPSSLPFPTFLVHLHFSISILFFIIIISPLSILTWHLCLLFVF